MRTLLLTAAVVSFALFTAVAAGAEPTAHHPFAFLGVGLAAFAAAHLPAPPP